MSHREPNILGHLNLHGGDEIGDVGLGRRWRADIMKKTQSETSIRVLSGQNIPRRTPHVITHTLGWAQQLINIDPQRRGAENENGKIFRAVGKRVSLPHWL